MKGTLLLTASCWLLACQQAPKADKAKISDAQQVQAGTGTAWLADTTRSIIKWVGTKPTGRHEGSIRLAGGVLYIKDTAITGGRFTLNMHTLKDLDLTADPPMKAKLEKELKGSMFFDVEQYPEAVFEITGSSPFRPTVGEDLEMKDATHTIKGNLTIKNITKNISFPARIRISTGEVTATANFNMDRTLWGMTYRADKSLQDKLIHSLVNIDFNIVASR